MAEWGQFGLLDEDLYPWQVRATPLDPAGPAPFMAMVPDSITASNPPARDLPELQNSHGGSFVTGLLNAALSGFTLPGDVLLGRYDIAADVAEKGLLGRSADTAGLAMMGSLPASSRLASRTVSMYDPPTKAPRPFEADYPAARWPDGPPADASGRLTRDIEGRQLNPGANVVGRRVVGGGDEAFAAIDALAEAGTGRRPQAVAPREIGGSAGALALNPITRAPTDVFFSRALTEPQASRVVAHEGGHLVDLLSGTIPQKGLSDELRGVYNTLNNGNRGAGGEAASWGRPSTPKSAGYSAAEAPAEHMAEAIRAYMADPNYLKTVAPKTAAAIRAAVNENPRLSPFIQFNAGGNALAGVGLLSPQNQD